MGGILGLKKKDFWNIFYFDKCIGNSPIQTAFHIFDRAWNHQQKSSFADFQVLHDEMMYLLELRSTPMLCEMFSMGWVPGPPDQANELPVAVACDCLTGNEITQQKFRWFQVDWTPYGAGGPGALTKMEQLAFRVGCQEFPGPKCRGVRNTDEYFWTSLGHFDFRFIIFLDPKLIGLGV